MPAPDDAELLRLYLDGRNIACPKCGYNLRGCVGKVCPECGTGLVLHLQPVLRLPVSYSLGVTGLASGVVLGAVGALFGLTRGPLHAVPGLLAVLVCVPALLLWDKTYFRVRRRSREALPYLIWTAWAGAAIAGSQIVWMALRLLG